MVYKMSYVLLGKKALDELFDLTMRAVNAPFETEYEASYADLLTASNLMNEDDRLAVQLMGLDSELANDFTRDVFSAPNNENVNENVKEMILQYMSKLLGESPRHVSIKGEESYYFPGHKILVTFFDDRVRIKKTENPE